MGVRHPLKLHPESRCDALTGVEVELGRLGPRTLLVRYFVIGDTRHVRFPRQVWPAARTDGLWRHTCFELFVRGGEDPAYYEFNLSPSGQWAAYRFDLYRSGMQEAKAVGKPGQDPKTDRPASALSAALDLSPLLDLPLDRPWHLGLSAVIEERNGRLSYWALAHPPGAADFHHPDGFALELPATE